MSKDFYRLVEQLDWPGHLRDQALRAASSVVLNVAEGAELPSKKQKSKHPKNESFGCVYPLFTLTEYF